MVPEHPTRSEAWQAIFIGRHPLILTRGISSKLEVTSADLQFQRPLHAGDSPQIERGSLSSSREAPILHEHGVHAPEGTTWVAGCENSDMCGRYVSPDEASIEREFNLAHQESLSD
jgi:hypothetical protein